MMRSTDVAHIVWGIFHQDKKCFVCCTTKVGKIAVFSVDGLARTILLAYVHAHRHAPALFLGCNTKQPWTCLGSERIAKRLFHIMAQEGVDTKVFKAHSLRGATATWLLRKGARRDMVQARGGWGDTQTMDMYYSRLHQHQEWQGMLQGENAGSGTVGCAVHTATVPLTEPTQECGLGGTEWLCTAQATVPRRVRSALGPSRSVHAIYL